MMIGTAGMNHDNPANEVDEIVQGNIDGAMPESQIRNKKAFVWAFGKN